MSLQFFFLYFNFFLIFFLFNSNPLLSCDQIPEVDLSEWQDFAGAGTDQYDHEYYSHNYKK